MQCKGKFMECVASQLALKVAEGPGQRLHRAHVITTAVAGIQLRSSDIEFNFLLIAKMQQHNSARETDLHLRHRQMRR